MFSEPQRSVDLAEFCAVEEMEEAHRVKLGWNVDWRQLRRGQFLSRLRVATCDNLGILSSGLSNHLQCRCEPPTGLAALFLPELEEGGVAVSGKSLTDRDLVVFPQGSELEFVSKDVRNRAIFLPQADFLAAARSLVPSFRLAPELAAIVHGDSDTLAMLKQRLDDLLREGAVDSEAVSDLLAETILWIADASGTTGADRLANGAAAAIAARARGFLEDHFHENIRMQDLCNHTGVGLRTLQRCFAAYYQLAPVQYIKARRLNAARRNLVAGNPDADRVTMIAARNGFRHLGRFSIDYRAHFGESPRDTLARPTRTRV